MSSKDDKEIKAILEDITIIVDTRENLPNHLTLYFDKNDISYKIEKVDYGDYGIEIQPNVLLGNKETVKIKATVERKMNLDEIATNLTRGKERFKREMKRCKDDGGFMIIMIESATYSDIINKNYRSKLTPKQFLGLLHGLVAEFGIVFVFKSKEESPLYVYNTLKYCAREYIKNNKLNN